MLIVRQPNRTVAGFHCAGALDVGRGKMGFVVFEWRTDAPSILVGKYMARVFLRVKFGMLVLWTG